MKSLILAPGKVGVLSTYLGYLFLRFPGALGPEQKVALECLDTYDRRWSRQGRIWVRRDGELSLVAPPSITGLEESPSAWGLQVPQLLCKVSLRVRPVTFTPAGAHPIDGYWLKVGSDSYLILNGDESKGFAALESAVVADGMTIVPPGEGWWVKDRGPGFEGLRSASETSLQSPAAPFLLERLRDGLRVARQYEKGTRDDVDTECLHQYRVHLRRVRSLASLGLMWEVVPEWARLKNLLRELQQRTNELRDLDVLLLDLPLHRAALPWGEGDRLDGWGASLVRRRKAQWRRVKAWFESEDHALVHAEIDRLFDDLARYGEPWTVGDLTASAFERSSRGLKKALREAGIDSPDERLHEVRIRTKRLRYVLDGLGFLGAPGAVRTLTALLKRSQEGLGEFQDRSILLERLKTEVSEIRSGSGSVDLLAFGILVGTLASDHEERKREALDDVRRLKSRTFLKALRELNAAGEASHGP